MPEKPGFEIAVKEEAHGGGAGSAPRRPSRSRNCCRPLRSRRAPPPPRSAPPATPSRRAAPTASARTCYGIVDEQKGEGRGGFNFSAAMKAKGGTWTFDDLNKFIANPKGFVPGTAMGFAGIQKDSERADVIAYLRTLVGQPGSAADGVEITFRQSGMDFERPTARHCLAVFVYRRSRIACYRDVSPHRRRFRAVIMRKKQRNRSNPCLILGPQ